jgi:hypothetical protein
MKGVALLQHRPIRRPHTVGMQKNWGAENEHGHEKRIMEQEENRYGKDNWLRKKTMGMENHQKVSKIIARRMRTNQDGDENEERRRRTDKDTNRI